MLHSRVEIPFAIILRCFGTKWNFPLYHSDYLKKRIHTTALVSAQGNTTYQSQNKQARCEKAPKVCLFMKKFKCCPDASVPGDVIPDSTEMWWFVERVYHGVFLR